MERKCLGWAALAGLIAQRLHWSEGWDMGEKYAEMGWGRLDEAENPATLSSRCGASAEFASRGTKERQNVGTPAWVPVGKMCCSVKGD